MTLTLLSEIIKSLGSRIQVKFMIETLELYELKSKQIASKYLGMSRVTGEDNDLFVLRINS